MESKNKLDKIFGPVGTLSGKILFIAGLCISYFSVTGFFLVLLGSFIGFSSTSTRIDFEKKRIKFSNNIFGMIPIGQWTLIKPDMKIGIKKSNK